MFSRSSFSASTATLASTNSTASTIVQKPASKQRTEKDYFAALGALQSSYGFGGAAPTIPTLSTSTKSKKAKSAPSTPAPATAMKATQPRDYEAAYGALSSSYGFGGAAPTMPQTNASWLKK